MPPHKVSFCNHHFAYGNSWCTNELLAYFVYCHLTSYKKNQLDELISQIYFWNETLNVSNSSSFHHQEFFTVHAAIVYVIQVCWQLASSIRMELRSKNKFEKLVHLVGFIIRIYHDARSHERQICHLTSHLSGLELSSCCLPCLANNFPRCIQTSHTYPTPFCCTKPVSCPPFH